MRQFSSTIQAIVDAEQKYKASWLFTVTTVAGTRYYWSTSTVDAADKIGDGIYLEDAVTVGGGDGVATQAFEFKIVKFGGVTLQRQKNEFGLISPSRMNFSVTNKGNVLSSEDFEGASVWVDLAMSDGIDPRAHVVRRWRFKAVSVDSNYEQLDFVCEDFFQQYLEGYYPETSLIAEAFPDTNTSQDLCVPVTFGAAYIPLVPVYTGGTRVYLVGKVVGGSTVSVDRVRTPRNIAGKVEWVVPTDASWVDSGTVVGADGVSYHVGYLDTGIGGAPLWVSGDKFEAVPTRFTMSNGTYTSTNPAQIVYQLLLEFGISETDIDQQSVTDATAWFSSRGIEMAGGWWTRQERKNVLANLLNQAGMDLVCGEQIEFKPFDNTSVATVDSTVVIGRRKGEGSFKYKKKDVRKIPNAGYVAWQEATDSIDALLKDGVTVDGAGDKKQDKAVEINFIHDQTQALKLGMLVLQRQLLKQADLSFTAKGILLSLDPTDTITVSDSLYGPTGVTFKALVDSVTVASDLSLKIKASHFYKVSSGPTSYLDDYDSLVLTGAIWQTDSSDAYSPITAGPDNDGTSDTAPNWVPGPFRVGNAVNFIRLDPTETSRNGPVLRMTTTGVNKIVLGDLYDERSLVDAYGLLGKDAAGAVAFEISTDRTKLSAFEFDQNALTYGSLGTRLGLGYEVTDGVYGVWAGAESFNAAPFSVSSDGALKATNATISGTITVGAGSSGYDNLTDTPPLAQSLWVPADGEVFTFTENVTGSKGTSPL